MTLRQSRFGPFELLLELLDPADLLVVNASTTFPPLLPTVDGQWLRLVGRYDPVRWLIVGASERDSAALPENCAMRFDRLLRTRDGHTYSVGRLDCRDQDPYLYLLRHGSDDSRRAGSWGASAPQSVFARVPGSTDLPTAALPFEPGHVQALRCRGVQFVSVVLHAGATPTAQPGTELYEIGAITAARIRAVKAAGGRIIAVGTTVVRALESAALTDGVVRPQQGLTSRIVYRNSRLRVVDGVITGVHASGASHLQMLEAVVGARALTAAYRHFNDDAPARVDAHLLLRPPRSPC